MGAAADNDVGGAAPHSLVDGAERALRGWLSSGRFRAGDRLPPEQQLAKMLGVSRGTLRAALHRLEGSAEIVRRQGSGTFVGRVGETGPTGPPLRRSAAGPPLRVDSLSARSANGTLAVAAVDVGRGPLGEAAGEAFALAPSRRTTRAQRVLARDQTPAVVAHDIFHPGLSVPSVEQLRATLRAGRDVHELVEAGGGAIAVARSRISARTLNPGEPLGERLALSATTGCLVLEELVLGPTGDPLLYSWDVIAPGIVEIEVVRSAGPPPPDPDVVRPAGR